MRARAGQGAEPLMERPKAKYFCIAQSQSISPEMLHINILHMQQANRPAVP